MEEIKKEEITISELIILYKNGSIEARDILIKHFIPKAESIASEYFDLGIEKEEIIASAYEGLVLAVTKLKKINHNNYNSVIDNLIKYNITDTIINHYKLKGYLGHKYILISVLIAKRDLIKELHRTPTLEEIKERLSLSIKETREILDSLSKNKSTDFKEMTLNEQREIMDGVIDPEHKIIYEHLIYDLLSALEVLPLTDVEKEKIQMKFLEGKTGYCCQLPNQLLTFLKIRKSLYFKRFIEDLDFDEERNAVEEEMQYIKRG